MFDTVLEAIEDWAREMLEGMVDSNVSTMFADVNEKTASIAGQVSATPSVGTQESSVWCRTSARA